MGIEQQQFQRCGGSLFPAMRENKGGIYATAADQCKVLRGTVIHWARVPGFWEGRHPATPGPQPLLLVVNRILCPV